MLNIGEWKTVKIGDATAVGYVSNIISYSWHSERVELTKVGWLSSAPSSNLDLFLFT
ncbi:hypothetical protein [Domibacillus tundrae]|uniref:hypothetical protein n=1 Tax=Domibacillus tundrae TaxID=1587527 RepID=UPI003392252D